mmetsp:Transcript_69660/g.181484  ORF Transcript_69660/g.181484 Transcript_69660/m.181484 type:complete len:91 (+) Transcript_69660:2-274(+)
MRARVRNTRRANAAASPPATSNSAPPLALPEQGHGGEAAAGAAAGGDAHRAAAVRALVSPRAVPRSLLASVYSGHHGSWAIETATKAELQ